MFEGTEKTDEKDRSAGLTEEVMGKIVAIANQKGGVGNGKKVIMKSRVIKRLGIKGILLNNLA